MKARPAKKPISKEYFEFSTWGEPDEGPQDIYRWPGVTSLDYSMIERLRQCTRIEDWPMGVVGNMDSVGPQEDAPSFPELIGVQIVSDRARKVSETLAPDAAQYLPVRLVHGNVGCTSEPYWVVNWLCLIDAVDWDRSSVLNRGTEREQLYSPFVVSSRVPSNVHFCRLQDYKLGMIARKTARLAVRKRGLTGFIFERCLGD